MQRSRRCAGVVGSFVLLLLSACAFPGGGPGEFCDGEVDFEIPMIGGVALSCNDHTVGDTDVDAFIHRTSEVKDLKIICTEVEHTGTQTFSNATFGWEYSATPDGPRVHGGSNVNCAESGNGVLLQDQPAGYYHVTISHKATSVSARVDITESGP